MKIGSDIFKCGQLPLESRFFVQDGEATGDMLLFPPDTKKEAKSMKRLLAACLIFCFAVQTVSFALTEKELEYKWNKLDMALKYRSGVKTTWSEVSGKYYDASGGAVKAEATRDLDEWHATRQDNRLSEHDFLKLVGDDSKAFEVEFKQSIGWGTAWSSYFGILGGLVHWYLNSGKNQIEAQRGATFALVNVIVGLANPFRPGNHLVSFDETVKYIESYNQKLKDKLGIVE